MNDKTKPVIFTWDGDHMVPLARFKYRCDQQYVVHQEYRLVEEEERSRGSQGHYFACPARCLENMPDNMASRFAHRSTCANGY